MPVWPVAGCGLFVDRTRVRPAADSRRKNPHPASQRQPGRASRGPVVKDIVIEFAGSQSVDRSLILSNMRTTIGQPYSPNAVQEDVRNLYATGQFVNLRIYDEPLEDGVRVVVIVQPKAAIKQIIITGNDKISEKAVRKKIKSKAGEPLSEQQIAEDARAVRTYYQDKGFHNATVEYKFDINEQVGRAVVTFTIREETKAFVRNVDFVNSTAYETKELRKLFKTRQKNWLSFINKSGIFKQEQLDEDLKRLRDHYYKGGYIDFRRPRRAFRLPRGGVMDVTVEIFEGIPYTVGSLSFENNQLFSREQILGRLAMRESGVFSPQGLEGDIKAIKDLYGENGYIDVQVNAVRQPNIESGKMDLLYQLTEGPQSFVQKSSSRQRPHQGQGRPPRVGRLPRRRL
ncbi:MAG: hypothetical protein HC901_02500 [Bdellovibrionaceae bacterium]|nr:hypothetical protein [Pseudobdellovibrionaceae bacterium]